MDPGTVELICKAIITAGAAGGCVVLTPAILTGLGFGAGGVVAGSIAAQLMSLFGTTWLIALLQSIGAAGLGWFGKAFWSVFGAFWAQKLSDICKINITFNDEH